MSDMQRCPYCGEPLFAWQILGGDVSIDCNTRGCPGNISSEYKTVEEAIAAASKRYADTARLTEVTKQAVEAVQNVVDNSSGFIVDEVNFDFVNTFTRIFSAANVIDEHDAVELSTLVMAAIAEAFEPGGAA